MVWQEYYKRSLLAPLALAGIWLVFVPGVGRSDPALLGQVLLAVLPYAGAALELIRQMPQLSSGQIEERIRHLPGRTCFFTFCLWLLRSFLGLDGGFLSSLLPAIVVTWIVVNLIVVGVFFGAKVYRQWGGRAAVGKALPARAGAVVGAVLAPRNRPLLLRVLAIVALESLLLLAALAD